MIDREKVIKGLETHIKPNSRCVGCPYPNNGLCGDQLYHDALSLLKEQEEKRITLHKKHVITWSRTDEFSMRKLYETICETLLDEGELVIARTDDHEKVDFVFYVAEGR